VPETHDRSVQCIRGRAIAAHKRQGPSHALQTPQAPAHLRGPGTSVLYHVESPSSQRTPLKGPCYSIQKPRPTGTGAARSAASLTLRASLAQEKRGLHLRRRTLRSRAGRHTMETRGGTSVSHGHCTVKQRPSRKVLAAPPDQILANHVCVAEQSGFCSAEGAVPGRESRARRGAHGHSVAAARRVWAPAALSGPDALQWKGQGQRLGRHGQMLPAAGVRCERAVADRCSARARAGSQATDQRQVTCLPRHPGCGPMRRLSRAPGRTRH
jgi:hypothetical protein